MDSNKVVLIGGTSHAGKSTLARRLADDLGWDCLSTDQLARHPGRPWKVGDRPVPEDVVEHYSELTVAELVDSVLLHYRNNVWPIVDAMVRSRLANPFDRGLVFEGSAILPEFVHVSECARVSAIWLTAPEALIEERVLHSSDYANRRASERQSIDAFLGRTLAIDRFIREGVERNNQTCLNASTEDLYKQLRSLLQEPGSTPGQ